MGIFSKPTAALGVFGSFKATEHSQRLERTYGEVQTFKRQLMKADAALRTYAKATEEVLKVTDDSLASFPRVWRKADGAAAALPEEDVTKDAPTAKKLGAYPSSRHTVAMQASLQEEVHIPIERWHKQYAAIKTRLEGVEAARAEYDAARKGVAAARNAELKHARKTDGREDDTLSTEEARAEAVLNAKREAYIAMEEEVHVELLGLVADAQGTLSYCTRALQLTARALMSAADDFSEKEASMPTVERASSGPLPLGEHAPNSPTGTTAAGALHPIKPTGYRPDFEPSALQQKEAPTQQAATHDEALPAAPTHAASRLQDSASEFPPAPAHAVGSTAETRRTNAQIPAS